MKVAAGTTSSTLRSNGARAIGSFRRTAVATLLMGVHQHALDRHVHAHVVAERIYARSADVHAGATGRTHVEERIAAAVLDVVDLALDHVEAIGGHAARHHAHLFRTGRHHCAA